MLEQVRRRQALVLTRGQAVAGGLTVDAVRARLASGRWQRVFTGVYYTASGPLPEAAEAWAVVLRAGAGAALSHHSAAELSGLAAPRRCGPRHVTVPFGRRVAAIPGVVVHTRRRVEPHPTLLPPRTRIERTVVDLTQAAADLDEAAGWLVRACAERLTTPARLAAALAAEPRLRWRRELSAALADVADGCHSPLEARYAHRVERRHSLPVAVRQRRLRRGGGTVVDDVAYPAFGLAVELDGRLGHAGDGRFRDLHRDNAHAATGTAVLRYGWADVTERPCLVAAQVAAVLHLAGWTGAPDACGPGCAVRNMIDERLRGWGAANTHRS